MIRVVLITVIAATAGCSCQDPPPSPSGSAEVSASPATTPVVIEDDIEQALALARSQGKLLFVDVWAPWCAPCLSFRAEVLQRLHLVRDASSFVFASLDTDRPGSAPFLERHGSRALPTLIVLRPADESIIALRSGAVSLAELEALLAEGLRTRQAPPDDARGLLVRGHAAYGRGDKQEAAELFQAAARRAGGPVQIEATIAAVDTLADLAAYPTCAAFGSERIEAAAALAELHAMALPLIRCADALAPGPERDRARRAAIGVLDEVLAAPVERQAENPRRTADALALRAELHRAAGEPSKAIELDRRRLVVLETAAGAAASSESAQAYDHDRVKLYLELGRGDEALTLLRKRAEERPDSYETHGRLGTTLAELGRASDAIAPLERAIALGYGAPRLVYLGRLAAAVAATGDTSWARELLQEEVAGWRALPAGQRDDARMRDAETRLAAMK